MLKDAIRCQAPPKKRNRKKERPHKQQTQTISDKSSVETTTHPFKLKQNRQKTKKNASIDGVEWFLYKCFVFDNVIRRKQLTSHQKIQSYVLKDQHPIMKYLKLFIILQSFCKILYLN